MSYDVVIIHGSFGDPFGNWQPWLFQEAAARSKRVLCPHFPGPQEQNLESWGSVLDAYSGMFGENTTIFAHSLGPAFVLDYLVSRTIKIKRLVAVAPFYGLIGIEEFDNVNKTFFLEDIDFSTVPQLCRDRFAYFSDNDPYVPRKMSESFCANISAGYKVIPNGGHLNSSAGYTEFPHLLEHLE
jgi:uncharacterized protein